MLHIGIASVAQATFSYCGLLADETPYFTYSHFLSIALFLYHGYPSISEFPSQNNHEREFRRSSTWNGPFESPPALSCRMYHCANSPCESYCLPLRFYLSVAILSANSNLSADSSTSLPRIYLIPFG
jgi:hypothetical protein